MSEKKQSLSSRIWHSIDSVKAAVATYVEDELEDKDWLRKPKTNG